MSTLLALDIAILLPADVTHRAVTLSEALPAADFKGLRLGAEQLPHITLVQSFVREDELEQAYGQIDEVLRYEPPLQLSVTGGAGSNHVVSLLIEPAPALLHLHERLMDTLRGVERPGAGPGAFVGGEGRAMDVLWVASYRLQSAFGAYVPHITLGHGPTAPAVEPFRFESRTVAACHLGRFCTCRRVLRSWTLAGPPT